MGEEVVREEGLFYFLRAESYEHVEIKPPVQKLKENTGKRVQLEPLLRYLEVKKRCVF